MKAPPPAPVRADEATDVILGFDIGSTGSKVVALDLARREPIWEGYRRTSGDPVGAAQALMRDFLAGPAGEVRGPRASARPAAAARSSARSSRPATARDAVFVLNEIAAHAKGAPPLRPAGRHDLRDRRPGREVHPARERPGGRRRHERGVQRRHRLLHRGAGRAVRRHRATSRSSARSPSSAERERRARPALLGVHGRGDRRGGRRGRAARPDHRRALRLGDPELPEPREGQPLGRGGHLLPGHALRLRRARGGGGAADRGRGDRARRAPAPSAPSASRCSPPRRSRSRATALDGRPLPRGAGRGQGPVRLQVDEGCGGAATSAASTGSRPTSRARSSASPGAAAARSTTRARASGSCPTAPRSVPRPRRVASRRSRARSRARRGGRGGRPHATSSS